MKGVLFILLVSSLTQIGNLEGTYMVIGGKEKFIFKDGVASIISQGQSLKYSIEEYEDET